MSGIFAPQLIFSHSDIFFFQIEKKKNRLMRSLLFSFQNDIVKFNPDISELALGIPRLIIIINFEVRLWVSSFWPFRVRKLKWVKGKVQFHAVLLSKSQHFMRRTRQRLEWKHTVKSEQSAEAEAFWFKEKLKDLEAVKRRQSVKTSVPLLNPNKTEFHK